MRRGGGGSGGRGGGEAYGGLGGAVALSILTAQVSVVVSSALGVTSVGCLRSKTESMGKIARVVTPISVPMTIAAQIWMKKRLQ